LKAVLNVNLRSGCHGKMEIYQRVTGIVSW
jgi:hypothetical protein